jgi:Protein of unknown function (DUF2975)
MKSDAGHSSTAQQISIDPVISRLLAWTSMGLAILLPVVVATLLVSQPSKVVAAAQLSTLKHVDIDLLPPAMLLFAGVVALLPVVAVSRALWIASSCFRDFSAGNYFVQANVLRLRDFARWMLLTVVLGVLATPVLSFILTRGNAGGGAVQLSLGSTQFLFLIFAGFVWQISRVFAKAIALSEENEQFV